MIEEFYNEYKEYEFVKLALLNELENIWKILWLKT